MMPEGLEAGITPEQMADLIAYIRSGAPRRKQLPGNTPVLVKQSAPDGSLLLPATAAEFYGEGPIVLETEFRNVGYWNAPGDYVAWTIQLDKAGEYDVYADYACAAESAGGKYVLAFGPASVSGTVAATGADWSNYRQAKLGTVHLATGQQRATMRPDGSLRSALIDLRTLGIVPKGSAPKWPKGTRAAPAMPADLVLRDAPTVTRFIMDGGNSTVAREAVVNANPQFAAEIIAEMTRDLAPGPGEYERIPWIWRVAIAAGKRNDASSIRRILDVALPKSDQPIRDWQAVVIGGGIINGLTQSGLWPGDRIGEIIGDDAALKTRWARALDLASAMADDEKVPNGTRYDALRMLGVEPWDKCAAQLTRYLRSDVNGELQMGAVSGVGDVRHAAATDVLIAAVPDLTKANRKLAIDALLRDEARLTALRAAVAAGKIHPSMLDADQKARVGSAAKNY
jgi:hypothetical protein